MHGSGTCVVAQCGTVAEHGAPADAGAEPQLAIAPDDGVVDRGLSTHVAVGPQDRAVNRGSFIDDRPSANHRIPANTCALLDDDARVNETGTVDRGLVEIRAVGETICGAHPCLETVRQQICRP